MFLKNFSCIPLILSTIKILAVKITKQSKPYLFNIMCMCVASEVRFVTLLKVWQTILFHVFLGRNYITKIVKKKKKNALRHIFRLVPIFREKYLIYQRRSSPIFFNVVKLRIGFKDVKCKNLMQDAKNFLKIKNTVKFYFQLGRGDCIETVVTQLVRFRNYTIK